MPHLISNLYEKNYTPFTAKLAPRNLWNRPVLGKFYSNLLTLLFVLQEESHKRLLDLALIQLSRLSGDSLDHGSATTIRPTTLTLFSAEWVSTTSGGTLLLVTTDKETLTDPLRPLSKLRRSGISSSQRMTMMMRRMKKRSDGPDCF